MTCDRYWREGIALVERGEPDPHRASCEDCRRAHAARHELVSALPMIGSQVEGDPHWQSRVWRQIDHERPSRTPSWWVSAALAAACLTTVVWLLWHRADPTIPTAAEPAAVAMPTAERLATMAGTAAEQVGAEAMLSSDGPGASSRAPISLPWIEIISGPVAMRSASARVGDRVRISARPHDEIRVYRAEQLMLQCSALVSSAGCTHTEHGLVSVTTLDTAGDYQLVVIKSGAVKPVGSLTTDLAAIVTAGGEFQLNDLAIR